MQKNIETVQRIYAAFGRGDVNAILDCLADDVGWESWSNNFAQKAGVPWMKAGKGRAAAADFFRIASEFKISRFDVIALMAGPSQISAEIEIATEVPGGGAYRDQEMHLWTFNDGGKVTRFRHYVDTAKHIAASKGQRTD